MVSQKPKYCINFERNSHWRKLSMIMVWERYCNASSKPEFFLFSLFIFSFISQLIWVCLGWNFHRSMIFHTVTSKLMYNWSFLFEVLHKQHSYPVLLMHMVEVSYPTYEITLSSSLCTFNLLEQNCQGTYFNFFFIVSLFVVR